MVLLIIQFQLSNKDCGSCPNNHVFIVTPNLASRGEGCVLELPNTVCNCVLSSYSMHIKTIKTLESRQGGMLKQTADIKHTHTCAGAVGVDQWDL